MPTTAAAAEVVFENTITVGRGLGLPGKSIGWGTWIRTKINGVRVRSKSLIRKGFSVNYVVLNSPDVDGSGRNYKACRGGSVFPSQAKSS
jgi:hypothetical protein